MDEEQGLSLDNDESYDNDENNDESYLAFNDLNSVKIQREAIGVNLRQREANIEQMDVQINALERNFNIQIPKNSRGRFRLIDGYLQIERGSGDYVNLNKSNGEFLAASTLRVRLGASLARSLLGIETPSSLKTRSRVLLKNIPTEIEMEDFTNERLVGSINDIMTEMTRNAETNTDLDMREFLGLDKALTRIKGELVNNASKLTEIDEHIEKERKKLAEIEDSPDLRQHKQRVEAILSSLKDERSARLEIMSQNEKALSSQYSRIKQTCEKILDNDLTLTEKIKLIFREHGLTIAAVLTSISLIISTLVTTLTGGSSAGKNTPPKNSNKLKEWVKNKLKALARLFGRLAGKAAAALPGIIGSIVAGVFNFLKKVVTAPSQHVWLFITSIATLIGYRLLYPPNNKKR